MKKTIIFLICTICHLSAAQIENKFSTQLPDQKIYNKTMPFSSPTGFDFTLRGNYLYWQARLENTEIGEAIDINSNRHTISIKEKYTSGFKAALGLNFNQSKWFLEGEYLYFHVKNVTPSVSAHEIVQNWFVSADTLIYRAEANWSLKLDFAHVTLAKPFFLSPKISLIPSLGLYGGRLKQALNTFFHTSYISLISESHPKTNSWLVGPGVNLNTVFNFNDYFGFAGGTGISLLYQKYTKIQIREYRPYHTSNDREKLFTDNGYSNIVPYFNILLGLRFGSSYQKNTYQIDGLLGYEIHVFWDQNYLESISSRNNNPNSYLTGNDETGPLILHGLSAALGFRF